HQPPERVRGGGHGGEGGGLLLEQVDGLAGVGPGGRDVGVVGGAVAQAGNRVAILGVVDQLVARRQAVGGGEDGLVAEAVERANGQGGGGVRELLAGGVAGADGGPVGGVVGPVGVEVGRGLAQAHLERAGGVPGHGRVGAADQPDRRGVHLHDVVRLAVEERVDGG